MGVDGLWHLLESSGSKISIESLSNKVIAVDASLWLVQFVKGMRTENGQMIKNAHLIGMFRRICKLLYFNIKPVFVFDGPAPALKRETLQKRRLRREKSEIDMKEMAEKILLNQLKMAGISEVKKQLKQMQEKKENEPSNETEDEEDIDIIRPLRSKNEEQAIYDQIENDDKSYFDELPTDISLLTAEDIAQYPAAMQYQLMQRRRELLHAETRAEFFRAANNPQEYANVQLKNFLKTSSLNTKIETIRKRVKDEYHQQLAKETNVANVEQSLKMSVFRIASEANKLYYVNDGNDGKERQFNYRWMDKTEKEKRKRFYRNKRQCYKKGEYIPQTLNTESNDFYVQCNKHLKNETKSYWNCPKCKHLNLKKRECCDVCGMIREEALQTWKCVICDHINEGKFASCVLCDSLNEPSLKKRKLIANEKIDYIDESDDDFLQLTVPQITDETLQLFSINSNVNHTNQNKCSIVCSNENISVSQILTQTEMDSMLTLRNSLNNFYKIARRSNSNIMEIDDTQIENEKQSQIANEKEKQASVIYIEEEEDNSDSESDDITFVPLLDISSKCITDDESSAFNSDDDIIEEMNLDFGTIINDTPGKNINYNSIKEYISNSKERIDCTSMKEQSIPKSFVIEIPSFDDENVEKEIEIIDDNHSKVIMSIEEEDEQKKIEINSILLNHTSNTNEKHVRFEDKKIPQIQHQSQTTKENEREEEKNIDFDSNLNNLTHMNHEIMQESVIFSDQHSLMMRDSEHVTSEMIVEVCQLLDMFGIPYITSPAEAEAQCAMLNKCGLVDGIITDDSDVFLFGGCTVYKHFFHMKRFVEKYSLSAIEQILGLNRKQLICMAMLLGSDYTSGIKNVGIVNGIEIVQAFCYSNKLEIDVEFEGLVEFKKWIYSSAVVTANESKRPSIHLTAEELLNIDEYEKYLGNKRQWFKFKHQIIKKHWFVSRNFPNWNVIQTYLQPNVDENEEQFEWGLPNINLLRNMCETKFHWDGNRIRETFKTLKNNAFGNKRRDGKITSYMEWSKPNAHPQSKRIRRVVQEMIKKAKVVQMLQKQS